MRGLGWLVFLFSLLAPATGHAETACLLCNLPSGMAEGQAEFDARIKAAYPAGAKVADMTDGLKAQKFREDYWRSRRLVFRYDRGGSKFGACSIVAYVDWHDDGAGYIASTEAHYVQAPECDALDRITKP